MKNIAMMGFKSCGKGAVGRALAKKMGVANWDLPSESCLATKFPEGRKLSAKELRESERN